MPPETFRSKIDLWLVAVMVSAAIAAVRFVGEFPLRQFLR